LEQGIRSSGAGAFVPATMRPLRAFLAHWPSQR